jgi:hypothetical protein
MNLDQLNPPVDLLADFDSMQTAITGDKTGEKTRRLATYFKQAQALSAETQLRTTDFEERHFAGLIGEAFGASRRIVLAAWQKEHGHELAA